MLAIDVVGKEHGFHLFGLVVVIEKFAQASGQEGDQLRDFLARNTAESLSGVKQVSPAAHAFGVDLGRRYHEERLQVARQLFELVVYLDESFSIPSRNLFEFRLSTLAIGPPGNDVAVRKGNLDGGIAGNHPQSVLAEPQIGNHLRAQHAGDIRCCRDAATRGDFFGYAAAADNLPPLEHESGESGTCQISGRGETVVTAADYDGVIGF